jgi:uncharacterized protein (TIGR00255 family)
MSHYSMTGFGKAEAEGENYKITIEMKSVNNRFKDYRFKLPSYLNFLELECKKILDKHFKRGTFDIFFNIKRSDKVEDDFSVDHEKIKKFVDSFEYSASKAQLTVNPIEFLRKDFLIDDSELREQELPKLVYEALEGAAVNLKKMREDEGKSLIEILRAHKEDYRKNFDKILPLREGYQDQVRDKIKKKFEENKELVNVEDSRFMQEVIYYLEKLDIDEEINRIETHLGKLDKVLTGGGEMGRQIDFLVQELGRETNTIGSKSGHSQISDSVVQMKVQLEKIREQALNLE